MLSRLREKYWLTGASTATRRVLSKRVVCWRMNSQQITHSPAERVTPDEPPVTGVGVDYFGPFKVKSRRSVVKRYGVIFTYSAICALHIEVAPSVDTDSFINAFRGFIVRRGQVLELYPDIGNNFIGAERKLRTAIEQWNQSQIQDSLLQKGIKWMFNPPAGSCHEDPGKGNQVCTESSQFHLETSKPVWRRSPHNSLKIHHHQLTHYTSITRSQWLGGNDHLLQLKTWSSLSPGVFLEADIYALRRWEQYTPDLFWSKRDICKEHFPLLQEHQKWSGVKRNVVPGDTVLIVDNTAPRSSWEKSYKPLCVKCGLKQGAAVWIAQLLRSAFYKKLKLDSDSFWILRLFD